MNTKESEKMCAVSSCLDEIYGACRACQNVLCYNHFVDNNQPCLNHCEIVGDSPNAADQPRFQPSCNTPVMLHSQAVFTPNAAVECMDIPESDLFGASPAAPRPSVISDGALLAVTPPDHALDNVMVDVVCNGLDGRPAKVKRIQPPKDQKPWATISASEHAKLTVNPIRKIVDEMSLKPNPNKELIKLHLGDPTLTGILSPHPSILQALHESITSGKYNGYGPAAGIPSVRDVLARHVTSPEAPVTSDDIILTSGCSHAIQMAIEVLVEPGDNILVPKPGFPLYSTLVKPLGVEDRLYNLRIDKDWEVDISHVISLIDERTKAIVVNNPSNPCGAVYSRRHLVEILEVADRFKIPIIADEIYGDLTFGESEFIPMATLNPKVPILCCDGIGKRYLVPGWRLGWVIIHDRFNAFTEVRDGLRQLAQKIVGPCAIVQGALPAILERTPNAFFEYVRSILGQNAKTCFEELSQAPGLVPVRSQGAMYMMVGIKIDAFDEFQDGMDFVKRLIAEESVYCLPGSAFHHEESSIRIVLTYPDEVMRDACRRIQEFCIRHYKVAPGSLQARKPQFGFKKQGFYVDLLADEPQVADLLNNNVA